VFVKTMETTAADLAQMLVDARARTLGLVGDLTDEQLIGPRLPIVNPLLWEIGHLAWFQEHWVLRHVGGEKPTLKDADGLYDSARVPHDDRWSLPLPSRARTLRYMEQVLDRVLDRIASRPLNEEQIYFCRLVTFHEDMHYEAFVYTRQTLGYPPPRLLTSGAGELSATDDLAGPWRGDVEIPGGPYMLGGTPDLPFVFDNEKWAHPVDIRPFRIAQAPVTNGEFVQFVDDRGYERRDLWSDAGWAWRERVNAKHPVYWQPGIGGASLHRRYDKFLPLEEHLPVIHVNWYEAEAYCRWAHRRLPTEAEWEMAASAGPTADGQAVHTQKRLFPWGDVPPAPERANLDLGVGGCIPVNLLPAGDSAFGCRQMIGNVWEWTVNDFDPFPGFAIDPYKEYSEPWFGGTHKVLRGGAFVTRSRLIRNSYRNFYTPGRRDVLAGFRTCSLEDQTR
jgi:iron(II)-dependent oxidoreductase